MLFKLSIENYALIQALEIDFSAGFSVITGETGAGKSILLGALSLILGQRADSGVLLDPSRKCIVEGAFLVGGYHLEAFFADNELDFDTTVILRREINQGGKSRAFINDSPVNLPLLKDLGDRLVNIHSQHAIITLNDANFQLAVLDNYAGLALPMANYRLGFNLLNSTRLQLSQLKKQAERAQGDRDYFLFLLDELNKAALRPGEQEDAELRLSLLTNAEVIKAGLLSASHALSEGDVSALNLLSGAIHDLVSVVKYKPEFNSLIDRIQSDLIDIKDVAGEIHVASENIYFDAAEIANLSQRLDLINRLHKKHQTVSLDELLQAKQNIEGKLVDSDNLEEKILLTEREILKLESELYTQADKLSAGRKKVISKFQHEITQTLSKLGMSKARFSIECNRQDLLSKDGVDRVRFLFSANPGVEINEIAKIASGGELSRLMLSIKSMISEKNLLPTIIFDEIDNGVSGEVAGKVGNILKGMANRMQVIVITHLPQIAAKGSQHYRVFKREDKDVTRTSITMLSHAERVEEIAKMLSDENVSNAALQTAKELLGNQL